MVNASCKRNIIFKRIMLQINLARFMNVTALCLVKRICTVYQNCNFLSYSQCYLNQFNLRLVMLHILYNIFKKNNNSFDF